MLVSCTGSGQGHGGGGTGYVGGGIGDKLGEGGDGSSSRDLYQDPISEAMPQNALWLFSDLSQQNGDP